MMCVSGAKWFVCACSREVVTSPVINVHPMEYGKEPILEFFVELNLVIF